MDALGERGGMRLDQSKPAGLLKQGYTGFVDGDVVVAKITPCFENGKGAIASELSNGIGFGTTELHVLRCTGADRRWLFYVTQSAPFMKLGEGSMYGAGGQKRVPPDFVRNYRTPTPPLPVQHTIADFLDRKTAALDALIAKKTRLLDLLSEKRAALINQAVTRGLDPDVPMKDSGIEWIGAIPAHWEVRRLKRLVTSVEQGWSPECENRIAEEHEWGVLKAGCVNGGIFRFTENKALPAEQQARTRFQIDIGDVLMSRASGSVRCIGSIAIVSRFPGRLLLCDKLYRLRFGRLVVDRFLVHSLAAAHVRAQIVDLSSGQSTLKNIGQAALLSLPVAVPPIAEQQELVYRLDQSIGCFNQLSERTQAQITRLKEYRQALITAAVTGQLDIPEPASDVSILPWADMDPDTLAPDGPS